MISYLHVALFAILEAIINVIETEEDSTLLLLILSREFREAIHSSVNLFKINVQNRDETSDQKTIEP